MKKIHMCLFHELFNLRYMWIANSFEVSSSKWNSKKKKKCTIRRTISFQNYFNSIFKMHKYFLLESYRIKRKTNIDSCKINCLLQSINTKKIWVFIIYKYWKNFSIIQESAFRGKQKEQLVYLKNNLLRKFTLVFTMNYSMSHICEL